MPHDLLWFLLPIAAASGWWLSARQTHTNSNSQTAYIPADYYKGINYFLNEQPDKAIDVFVQMLEMDSESVEPHLALGNLFRRRGETDRAIRIHQNLIARPSLSNAHRKQALLELGHDYMQAGVFDRAESLLEDLVSRDSANLPALRLLLKIYEQEQEWSKALTTAERIEAHSSETYRHRVAHYYCELADDAMKTEAFSDARKLIRRALSAQPDSIRALIQQAHMDAAIYHHRGVIKACKRALKNNPEYLGDCIEMLINSYRQLERPDELESYIEALMVQQNTMYPVSVYADYLIEHKGRAVAIDFLMGYLGTHPSLPGLQRLLVLLQSNTLASDDDIRGVKMSLNVVAKLLENTPLFVCNNCGFSGVRRRWQCPGCRHWDTIDAVTGIPIQKDHLMTQVGH